MPKYYYTDATEALLMMANHNIKIGIYEPVMGIITHTKNAILCGGDEFIEFNKRDVAYGLFHDECLDKYYIHPDCHQIFEPLIGDLVLWTITHAPHDKETIAKTVGATGRYDFKWIGNLFTDKHFSKHYEPRIIRREGKLFFTPETEND